VRSGSQARTAQTLRDRSGSRGVALRSTDVYLCATLVGYPDQETTMPEQTPAERIGHAQLKIRLAEAELDDARTRFADTCADLWNGGNGYSLAAIGDLAGFGRQYIHQLVVASRARADTTV